MKGPISIFACAMLITLGSSIRSMAQTMPAIGDTLYYFIDELPKHINTSTAGANAFWNFNTLKAPYIEYLTVADPSERMNQANFAEASMVLVDQDGYESYLQTRGRGVVALGGTIFQLGRRRIAGIWKYSGDEVPYIPRLTNGKTIQIKTGFDIIFSVSELPREIKEGLSNNADSIRWEVDIDREIRSDGRGKIQIPGGQYEVEKIKVADHGHHSIMVYRKVSGWEEAAPEVRDLLVELYQPISFHFLNDAYSQPVASVYAGQDEQPVYVRYMAESYQAQYYETSTAGQWLYAYPNPAFSTVRFKIFDITPGQYEIHFFNILGKQLFRRTYEISGNQTIELEIGQLEKGTYLYSLVDANGNKLITKRLIVLKP